MACASSNASPGIFSLTATAQSKPLREVQRALKSLSSVQLTMQRSLAATRELDERFETAQQRADTSSREYLDSHTDDPDPNKLRQVRDRPVHQRAWLLARPHDPRAHRLHRVPSCLLHHPQVRAEQRSALILADKKVQVVSEVRFAPTQPHARSRTHAAGRARALSSTQPRRTWPPP
jgi:hypothetical protein